MGTALHLVDMLFLIYTSDFLLSVQYFLGTSPGVDHILHSFNCSSDIALHFLGHGDMVLDQSTQTILLYLDELKGRFVESLVHDVEAAGFGLSGTC
jgi:hypothetical protein